MCLVTRQRKVKILKKDLIVFKCITNNNRSVYHASFEWEKGKLYLEELLPRSINIKEGYNGDYTYADNIAHNKYYALSQCYYLSEGFHSSLTTKRAKEAGPYYAFNIKIVKFLIPKGSEVFYDSTGLIVSNQIMLL